MRRGAMSNKKIKVGEIAIILFLVPFFQPGCFIYMSIGTISCSSIFNLLKIISAVVFIFDQNLRFRMFTKVESALLLFVMLLGFFMSISNFVHTDSVIEFNTFFSFAIFCYMCIFWLNKRPGTFISALVLLFGIYNIIQLITVVSYYPNGIFNYTGAYYAQTLAKAKYFFGGKNQAIFYMLAFLVLLILKNEIHGKRSGWKEIIWGVVFAAELFVLDSSASLICLLLFGILCITASRVLRSAFRWIYKPYICLIGSCVFFVIVCVLGKASAIPLISQFLALFGRNVTFTNRIFIWEIALFYFLSNPVFGAGEISFYVMGTEIIQAHNMYLDYLFKYGVFSIIAYISVLLIAAKSLNRMKETNYKYIFISVFLIMLIRNCFDAMDNYMFILLMSIFVCYNDAKGGEKYV